MGARVRGCVGVRVQSKERTKTSSSQSGGDGGCRVLAQRRPSPDGDEVAPTLAPAVRFGLQLVLLPAAAVFNRLFITG